MAKIARLAASLTPLALATVAIAFAIKAVLDKDWSSRDLFDSREINWSPATINATEYRSPFVLCGYKQVDPTLNPNNDSLTIKDFTYVCQRYGAYGRNNTSCESRNVTGEDVDARYGDARLCQEIHWAGNLAIASTSFIGIGFFFTFFISFLSVIVIFLPVTTEEHSPRRSEDHAEASKHTTTTHSHQQQRHHARKRPHERFLLPAAPWINVLLIICFGFGAILYVFAQFYGVLAFVQSAPDNGAFAASGGSNADSQLVGHAYQHTPWVQGKALGVYASVAWLSAGLAAVAAALVWRLPKVSGRNVL